MKQLSALLALALPLALQAQTTHELHVMDYEFVPAALTIQIGDHVHIIFDDPDHTFTQVDQATWMANGTTPLPGGYNMGEGTPQPGTDFTITPTGLGTIYYVCQPHVVDHGMKGTIDVVSTGVEEQTMPDAYRLAPNPASAMIELITDEQTTTYVDFYDAEGKLSLSASLQGRGFIDVGTLGAGSYVVDIRNLGGALLSRRQLVIAR